MSSPPLTGREGGTCGCRSAVRVAAISGIIVDTVTYSLLQASVPTVRILLAGLSSSSPTGLQNSALYPLWTIEWRHRCPLALWLCRVEVAGLPVPFCAAPLLARLWLRRRRAKAGCLHKAEHYSLPLTRCTSTLFENKIEGSASVT